MILANVSFLVMWNPTIAPNVLGIGSLRIRLGIPPNKRRARIAGVVQSLSPKCVIEGHRQRHSVSCISHITILFSTFTIYHLRTITVYTLQY
jgi:hypothetical protein